MRSLFLSFLLLNVALAGCIGGSGFGETETKDVYGNTYAVVTADGVPPVGDSPAIGVSAGQFRAKADSFAADWSEDATLFTVLGLELAEGAEPGQAFAGPSPQQYTLRDRFLGDGLLPAWDYLYMSPSHVSVDDCRMLFVHVAHNGFTVAYEFDAGDMDFDGDPNKDFWVCGPDNVAGARPDWRIDSNEASSRILVTDSRFDQHTGGAAGVVWALAPASSSEVEAGNGFGAQWIMLSLSDLADPWQPEDFLYCRSSAGNPTIGSQCYDEHGLRTDEVQSVRPDEASLPPASGSGEIEFGFVFSGPQSARFDVEAVGHPELRIDLTVPAETPYESATIELRDPDGGTVDSTSFTKTPGSQTGTLSAMSPVDGEWAVRVSGDAGTPRVQFRWCALGHDPAKDAAIDCA